MFMEKIFYFEILFCVFNYELDSIIILLCKRFFLFKLNFGSPIIIFTFIFKRGPYPSFIDKLSFIVEE